MSYTGGPAVVPVPAETGIRRPALELRRGWHVLAEGRWRLVVSEAYLDRRRDLVIVPVRIGLHGELLLDYGRAERPFTRTPEEQIREVETARRDAAGDGPVSRLLAEDPLDRTMRAVEHAAAIDVLLGETAGEGGDGE